MTGSVSPFPDVDHKQDFNEREAKKRVDTRSPAASASESAPASCRCCVPGGQRAAEVRRCGRWPEPNEFCG